MVYLDNQIAWELFNANWDWFWLYYAPNVFDKIIIKICLLNLIPLMELLHVLQLGKGIVNGLNGLEW